jgi:ATP-dependent DNA helicase RecG
VTPLEDLLRTLEPPLAYLAGAPHQLGRAALPMRALHEKLARTVESAHDETVRRALVEIEALLEQLAAARPQPRDTAETAGSVSSDSSRSPAPSAELRRMLELVALLKARPATLPAARYRRTDAPVQAQLEALRMPVQYVKGVGPRRAEQLEKFGLATVEALLFHLPFRYEDRRDVRTIGGIVSGEEATIEAVLVAVEERFAGRRRRVLEAVAEDASGRIALVWFNQLHFFRSRYRAGQRVLLHGKPEPLRQAPLGAGRMAHRIVHPEIEVLEGDESAELGRVVPVYEKPTGMPAGAMRRIVHSALEHYAARVPSAIPAAIAAERRLLDLHEALVQVHQPPADADVEALTAATSAGHRAIVYDELFYLQLGLAIRKSAITREPGIAFSTAAPRAAQLATVLPFTFTGAQRRVIGEIEHDMAAPWPMHRLVQGDVGSGKTVLALHAALIAIDNGYQAALMAPTELLAEQHCETIRRLAAPVGLKVAILTGAVQGKLRGRTERAIARGDVELVIGTHALIQEGVAFQRLGLGVIDEQHRFGVMQRAMLKRHGTNPDILLMTATPIPRTLALTLYGDLDVSALDELPPGRRPIVTRVHHQNQRDRVFELVRRELDQGRQAYFVYPLVTESEKTDLLDATRMARDLAAGPLAGFRIGLVHGQMRADEKDDVMRRFRAGDHQVLVSTTVIEVGIDVPNATVMVIEHAERFGLAQLHQLRGRVGRGEHRSLCFLVASYARGDQARERLRVMEDTTDGFRIAEKDLELRGPGEFLGTRQSGLPDFRAANLLRDGAILRDARDDAAAWLVRDPALGSEESAVLREVLAERWAGRLELARVG